MQILDAQKEKSIWPIFRLGFRVFFLGGALLSVIAMAIWAMSLSGIIQLGAIKNPIWWHAHEMIFGFTVAIIAGFILTAVQNWTGIPGVRGWPLAVASLLWFTPRLLMPLIGETHWLVILTDIVWLPLVAIFIALPIIKQKQWRNLFFVPILFMFTVLNALTYFTAITQNWLLSERLFIAAVLLITALIAVMGGRVIPFFTSRATETEKPEPIKLLELIALGGIWFITLLWLLLPHTQVIMKLLAILSLITAAAQLFRMLRWNTLPSLKVPLLWILHIGYLFIPLGLVAFAMAVGWKIVTVSAASHFLTAGALGCVVLGMISRVSLGHSGRPLQPKRITVIAFSIIILAALARSVGPLVLPDNILLIYQSSAGLWVLAYLIFVLIYWPVLTKPRIDGRPG
ncbi:NnrS family protein [Kangiella sediminilitoris]|uniref:NnrS family protein n=1 Tax=Kangiella sediminilitoris TaxID=1144748 RepID=A0A1B3BB36_9GAMM|nr:NnrS family protein [Kangiella sediminilitoris]AOE49984.1 NnrS family protein [Kangiella sediminilitoris]